MAVLLTFIIFWISIAVLKLTLLIIQRTPKQFCIHKNPGTRELMCVTPVFSAYYNTQLRTHVDPGSGKPTLLPYIQRTTTPDYAYMYIQEAETHVTSHTSIQGSTTPDYSYMYIQEAENSRHFSYFNSAQYNTRLLIQVYPESGKLALLPYI